MYLSLSYQIIYKALKNTLIKIYRNYYFRIGFLLGTEIRDKSRAGAFFRPKGGGTIFFVITIDMQYFKGRLYFAFSAALIQPDLFINNW